RPQLSDLRDSGAIEQDADIVMFLHNPEKYNDIPAQDEPGVVELIIAKHRNGQTGSVKLRWIGEYTTFVNLDEKVKIENKKEAGPEITEEVALSEIEDIDLFDDNN
ncbi:MAG: DnaB-like helicase C-terminal domain-containing protein, partial [Clostridia bacterium]|nr:DnaB-like helicase C-terminal domain-containing protein [Clostridia bacterium]